MRVLAGAEGGWRSSNARSVSVSWGARDAVGWSNGVKGAGGSDLSSDQSSIGATAPLVGVCGESGSVWYCADWKESWEAREILIG